MDKIWGGVLVVTGLVACPCHLVFTLPIILGLLAGTGVGAILGSNTGLVYGVAGAYFIIALASGWYVLNRKRPSPAQARRIPARAKAR